MADEPRRSGRATKGQHKATSSSSPAPQPGKKGKGKQTKKSQEPEPGQEEDEQDVIRCICGNDDPNDKRAFIGCDACEVWQHNVCMGMPDDEDEVPVHYFCEQCRPEEHRELLQAIARGEKLWETRNKIWQAEQKRKKGGAKGGWLKKDVPPLPEEEEHEEIEAAQEQEETGSKRKRGQEVKEEVEQQEEKTEEKPTRSSRQDKRRKSAMDTAPMPTEDAETALVTIDQLPAQRKNIATALGKTIADDIQSRVKSSTYRIPDGQTAKSVGDHHASRIEYALTMNQGAPTDPKYLAQFRTLNANMKKNKMLISQLLDGTLTADELSTMSSQDMASEELQKERAAMKEQLDRQAVAIEQEGPKYRRTHKGDELIEDENAQFAAAASTAGTKSQPIRERSSVADAEMGGAGSPTTAQAAGSPTQTDAMSTNTRQDSMQRAGTGMDQRRQSSQQFDMNSIWAKTAQSPTSGTAPRPMQMPARRASSMQQGADGTKDDADVDRMLQDDEDETYSPAEYTGDDGIVWRGKLIQSAETNSPTVNARFVAGRDMTPTVAWRELLPSSLSIDGRLQIDKAEQYLSNLQWSHTSDVSILSLTPYDDAEAFETIFKYFRERQRYAVVNKDKPPMVKDLYIVPVEQGGELPSHMNLLELCKLKSPVEEKCLLAVFVIARAIETPASAETSEALEGQIPVNSNGEAIGGGGAHLPSHIRAGGPGPAGSPLNPSSGTFSPTANPAGQPGQPMPGYGAGNIPPNPYEATNPLVAEVLGSLQYAPSAQQIITADPNIAREKLEHLKRIMVEDLSTRTDINKLAKRLFEERQ